MAEKFIEAEEEDTFPVPGSTLERDDAWDGMACVRCQKPAMWCWIAPAGRFDGCQCNECGTRCTLREWHHAQGATTRDAIAMALAAGTEPSAEG